MRSDLVLSATDDRPSTEHPAQANRAASRLCGWAPAFQARAIDRFDGHDEHIESPALRIPDQRIEGGAAILRAGDAAINVFDRRIPATGGAVAMKFGELVIGMLVGGTERGHTGHNAQKSPPRCLS
jgi:hypothetical protein